MTAEIAVMLVEKVTYFGEFGYLKSSWVRRSTILMFLSSSRDNFRFLYHFCWFPAVMLVHTNLYKFGQKVSPHILYKKNCPDVNPGETLCIFTFFLFPDPGLYLLNGFKLILF